jgi:hypothetical protein
MIVLKGDYGLIQSNGLLGTTEKYTGILQNR